MTTSTPTRLKLSLKPSERAKAIEKGILGGLRTAQIGPGGANATAGTNALPQAAANAPGAAAAAKLTMLQKVCAELGVEWLPMPLAIGISKGKSREFHRMLGSLVTRPRYLLALIRSPHRFNADGTIAGEVSEEHKAVARAALDHITKQKAAKAAKETKK